MKCQEKLQQNLKNSDAPFIVLAGQSGSGKKTLLRTLYPNAYWLPDNSVESVRTMIKESNRQNNAVFILPDVDMMSVGAKNALLKIVEECRNGNRFIMTVQDEQNLLDTIASRAQFFYTDPYTPKQLFEYFWEKYPDGNPNDAEVTCACNTPGEVDTLIRCGGRNFFDYVIKVIDYIETASIANALKISQTIAFKGEEDKYDLVLFWKIFIYGCCVTLFDKPHRASWIESTSSALKKLRITGINKSALFTIWIFDILGV